MQGPWRYSRGALGAQPLVLCAAPSSSTVVKANGPLDLLKNSLPSPRPSTGFRTLGLSFFTMGMSGLDSESEKAFIVTRQCGGGGLPRNTLNVPERIRALVLRLA